MADGEWPADLSAEVNITGFALGLWAKKRAHTRLLSLIIDRTSSRFVVIVGNAIARQLSRSGRILTALQQVPQLPVSPFNSTHWNASSFEDCAVAFEVEWDAILGLDYCNPLCQNGRFVIEASQVTKREFETVNKARAFYGCSPVTTPSPFAGHAPQLPTDLQGLVRAATTPERALLYGLQGNHRHLDSETALSLPVLDTDLPSGECGNASAPATPEPSKSSTQCHLMASDTACCCHIGSDGSCAQLYPRRQSADPGHAAGSTAGDFCTPGPGHAGCTDSSSQDWPCASSWTAPSRAYKSRTLILWFQDPQLPGLLRPVIKGDEHLLKLYESGLPAWAVHMPYYGIFYRPWMRTVTWLLFVAISMFSLVMGFYDLYKNVPYLDQVLRKLIGSLHLPAASIFRWLDTHVGVRLSILCAYLFGKSQLATLLLYWAAQAAAFARTALAPLAHVLGPPCQAAWQICQHGSMQLWTLTAAVGGWLGAGVVTALSPLHALLMLLLHVLQPVFTIARAGLRAPVVLLGTLVGYSQVTALLLWRTITTFGLLFRSGVVSQASSTHSIASQAAWWYVVPIDAFEVIRASGMKVFRALQTLSRFAVQVGCDIARHKLTLTLRLRRQWAGWKSWWLQLLHRGHQWFLSHFRRPWPWPWLSNTTADMHFEEQMDPPQPSEGQDKKKL